MTITWKTLAQATLSGSISSVYAPPDSSTRASVSAAQLYNPTGGSVVVDVYLMPAAGTPADANKIDRITVPAGTAKTVFGLINQKVNPAGSIRASGNGVVLTISGSESV